MRTQGNGASQLIELIRSIGNNVEVNFEIGTVTAVSPLEIKLEDGIKIDTDDFILAESLTTHERTGSLDTSSLTVDMSAEGTGPHTHTVNSINASTVTFTIDSPLKVDDKVIVVSINENNNYVVIDKAVI